MATLESLRDQHAELQSMVSDLRSMITPELLSIRPNAMTAHRMLCELGTKVKDLLGEQDKTVYPELLIHEDPRVKSIAWGFINGQKPLRKMFEDYHKTWLKDCEFQFTDEFLAQTNDMFDSLMTRIDREQTILFPKLEQIGMFSAQT